VQHGGFVPGYTASLLHLPTRNITAVALLNSTGKVEASYLTRRALRLLLTGSPDAVPHPLIAPERERLEGRYRTARGSEWVVASAPDGGMTIDLGGSRVPLVPTSGDRLCAADSDGTWCFDFDIDRVGPASSVAASLTCEPQGRAERVD
jgi:hypothetical protein